MDMLERLRASFAEQYGGAPEGIVRAPGRVNLIGEHTDYNDGFVLPMAIDRFVWIAFRSCTRRQIRVSSLDLAEPLEVDLKDLSHGRPRWGEYIRGVTWALLESGRQLEGWEGVVAGNVPIGAGLSSSAALELAVARTHCAASGFEWFPDEMARLAQRAENEWVGVRCGLMDQMISAAAEDGHALLLDCRSGDHEGVPIPGGIAVVVLDTGTRRSLTASAYNQRRAECEAAATALDRRSLREVRREELPAVEARLPEPLRRRARHVVTENVRTLHAVAAMRRGDAAELGRLVNASHRSLRDDFEVSSAALDAMVAAAVRQPGCLGARMTGGGFAGCAIALVEAEAVQEFLRRVPDEYTSQTGHAGKAMICEASDGARLIA